MSTIVLRGGHVCCPQSKIDGAFDIVVEDGLIESVRAPGQPGPAEAQVIDLGGCTLIPAGIDLACTLRDPGREEEEPLTTLLEVAALGGYARVFGLPSTSPRVHGREMVEHLRARTPADGPQLEVLGALTRGDDLSEGKGLSEVGEMADAGAAGLWVAIGSTSDTLLRHALEYAATFKMPVILKPGTDTLVPSWVLAESEVSTRLGLPGQSAADEVIAVFRGVELARLTGARCCIGPISRARSLALIEEARTGGADVSGFTSVLNLVLDEGEHLRRRYETALRLDPPLQAADDVDALKDGVERGAIFVSAGHRPVSSLFKKVEMRRAEPGAATLGSALALLWSSSGLGFDANTVARATSAGPAAVFGRAYDHRIAPGSQAAVAVLDPKQKTSITAGQRLGKVRNHPLLGQDLDGGIRGLLMGESWLPVATSGSAKHAAE